MHNFFTPVEVKRPISNAYPPEALQRFNHQLYAITQPRVLSLADERKKIISWFRSLPLLERRQVSTFYSPDFCALLGRLWIERQNNIQSFKYRFGMKEGKYYVQKERSYRNYRQKQKELLEQIVMVSKSQLYEGITLGDSLLREPQVLLQLLDELQGGVVQYLGDIEQDQPLLENKQISFIEEAGGEPNLLAVWVGTFIMKQISLYYLKGTSQLDNICQHHRNQQRDYSLLWQELMIEQKQKLLRTVHSKSAQSVMADYMENLDIQFQWLPIVYREESQSRTLERWKECPPKELINFITYTPLSKAFELGNMYRMELILQIESLLTQKQKKSNKSKKNKAKKKKKKQQSQGKQKSMVEATNTVKKSLLKSKSYSEQLMESIQFKSDLVRQKADILSQQTNITQQQKRQSQLSQSNDIKEQKINTNKIRLIQQQHIQQQPKETIKYNQKLEQLYKKLKEDSRDKCRKIIFHRLIYILSQFGIIVKAYGSFASQLSLPDSDLDVSVDSSVLSFFSLEYLNHRNQVIFALQYIATLLKRFHWIKDFQLLDKAKVPLLTFSADASIYFELGPQEKTKFKVNNKKIDPEKAVVQVDITVQPFANTPEMPNCGLESTESLKAWMNVFPSLQKTIILLKLLLRKAQLNKTYDGGIGSYALSLLVIAYYRQEIVAPLELQSALRGFSVFLRKVYDQKWLIDPQGQIPLVKDQFIYGPVLKHPFDGHNILEKSSRFALVVEAISNWPSILEQNL